MSGYCYDMFFVSRSMSNCRVFSITLSDKLDTPRSGYPGLGAWATSLNQWSLAKETWATDVSPCITVCSYSSLTFSNHILNIFELLSPTFSCHCHHACGVVELVDVSALQFSLLCCPEVQRGSGCAEVIQDDPRLRWKTRTLFTASFLFNLQTF